MLSVLQVSGRSEINITTYMRNDDHAVLGQVEICLDSMCAYFHSPPERTHGILGIAGLVSPMCNRLWNALPVEGPFGYGSRLWVTIVVFIVLINKSSPKDAVVGFRDDLSHGVSELVVGVVNFGGIQS